MSPVQLAGFEGLNPGLIGVPIGPGTGTVPLPGFPGVEVGVFTFVTVELGGPSM